MNSKKITLNKLGISEALIGTGISRRNVPGEAFILEKHSSKIKAFYCNEFSTATMLKSILAGWVELQIVAPEFTELRPLPEYYKAGESGEALESVFTKEISLLPSESFGKLENGMYKYDAYALMPYPANSSRHSIIFTPCLAVFFEIKYGVKCVSETGALIQPVLFDIEYTERTESTDALELTVMPTDGIAPFEFSKDGVAFSSSNTLTFTAPENAKIFVRDNAGTITSELADASKWKFTIPA